MRVRTLMFVLSAGFLMSSCGDEETTSPSSPTTPSSTAPSGSTNVPAPAVTNRPPGLVTLDVHPKGVVLAGGTSVNFGVNVTDPDNDALTYTWDFGDETLTTTNKGVAHTFSRARDFRVRVTASDGKGGTSTAETTITAGSLDGAWTMETAAHETLRVSISHSGTTSISGTVSNGLTFSGRVGDPYEVVMRLEGVSYCVQAGTYRGTVSPNLNYIEVPGRGCASFALRR